MDVNYWDSLSDYYQNNVLEIGHCDRRGILKKAIGQWAASKRHAADLGCGAGGTLHIIKKYFNNITAVDFSQSLLEIAQQRHGLRNITYNHLDLTQTRSFKFTVDVSFCVNVLIAPDFQQRHAILATIAKVTKIKGLAFIIVPSFESILHVYHAMIGIDSKHGRNRLSSLKKMQRYYQEEVLSSLDGIVNIGGEATKCYMKEEMIRQLSSHRLDVKDIQKIEYDWTEEIDYPPKGLEGPYPWDWLFICKRN